MFCSRPLPAATAGTSSVPISPVRITRCRSVNTIWTGSDDGAINLTRDGGKAWTNVTPGALTPWSKVSQLEASHFDDESAYASINRFKLDDLHPHIYRTHDGGKSWTEIINGI